MEDFEKDLLDACVELDVEKVEELLGENTFDFNKMKAANGHGFAFTLMRRFDTKEFFDNYNDNLKNLKTIFGLLFENGLEFNEHTTTAKSNPKQDFGNILTTTLASGFMTESADILSFLIENGADVDYEDAWGNTPLFFASCQEVGEVLLNKCKNPHHLNKAGENALFYQVNNRRVFKLLLEFGLKSDLIANTGDSLLLHCVRHGDADVLEYLLKNTQNNINYQNPITNESILTTVQHKKMLELLINFGLNVFQLNEKGQSILFLTNKKKTFVEVLLKRGVDPNLQDEDGNTVLHIDGTNHLIAWVAHLFDFNIKNKNGDTVLDVYRKRNELELYGTLDTEIELIKQRIEDKEKQKKLIELKALENSTTEGQ